MIYNINLIFLFQMINFTLILIFFLDELGKKGVIVLIMFVEGRDDVLDLLFVDRLPHFHL